MKNSFPTKTNEEINKIANEFYKHFCDLIIETIKLLSISDVKFKQRISFTTNATQLFNYYQDKKQSTVAIMGHNGNWEWSAIANQLYFSQLLTGIYHPLSNKNMNALIYKMRYRGGNFVPMQQALRNLIELKQKEISTTIGLIADQTSPPENSYWTTFLNQDTPVFNGPEKIARKFNYPVLFISVKKIARSKYIIDAELLTETPNQLKEGELSELHTKKLEALIHEQPAYWLWSHKRWKHSYKRPKIQ